MTADDYSAYQDKVGEAILQALKKAQIKHVLNLSSIGAQHAEGTGVVKGLHRQEKRLNSEKGLNVLHLRPGYFMENLTMQIPIIKNTGGLGSVLRPDLGISMIATRDIGLKAAELLDQLKFTGQSVFEFIGPKEVKMTEAAFIIGKAIGKPDLNYTQYSPADVEKVLMTTGLKPKLIKSLLEMYKSFNDGKFTMTQQATPEHRAKTTLEEFSKTFAQIYNSKKVELAHSHS